ncbi:hypothetical protein QFC24_003332 [Naganishia onofrii]|uniref:Uncharacterized protein n=1 Tax=Naganishia onofrii TaxID=1851511 RepID=A0ACC2XKI3_9TREE|nr:hypothetical protein QFC24_003332 [Naganishia onofrii]
MLIRFSFKQRQNFKYVDPVVTAYISGLVEDEDEQVDDIVEQTRGMLEDATVDEKELASFMERLSQYLTENSTYREKARPTVHKLEKTIDMRKQGLSSTIALSGAVDLESAKKGMASRVDMGKLAKAEAKLKAKIVKRAQRDLYEGSKLMADAQKKQQSYEEMFMKVNPLQLGGALKGKSKDIHLENINVSFGSRMLLHGAELNLAYGRRYGVIGRNGIGKSSLLRNLALREVPVPTHISVLYVEQEIVGDDTLALDSVLKADVWRHKLITEEVDLSKALEELEKQTAPGTTLGEAETVRIEAEKDELTSQLGEVQRKLIEMEAETGPARASALLYGLGFNDEDQKKQTRAFSGGWRMRLALARALFVKPDLLMLDEPSNMLDLNAIAWLEDYLQSWEGTILVVSHDRAFLDAVATDIVHQHSQRLDYYKGNFSQFYATKSDRSKNLKKEYETQLAYRQHLQAYIDRWRYNANRAAQAQSKIKILEKLPELEPPEEEDSENFKFPDPEKISPPLLQLNEANFGYTPGKQILHDINIDVGLDSRITIIGSNGSGKSTLRKRVTPFVTDVFDSPISRNMQHIDSLDVNMSSVQFLQSRFPGQTEQEYRSHLGSFGITGLTSLQKIGTLSGGQKSRVAFAVLSLQRPHILLLDEPSNHLDIEGIDALIDALKVFKGGVISVSHDERFITNTSNQLWVCSEGKVTKFMGDITAYKDIIVNQLRAKNRP